jgi:hypothetical protein
LSGIHRDLAAFSIINASPQHTSQNATALPNRITEWCVGRELEPPAYRLECLFQVFLAEVVEAISFDEGLQRELLVEIFTNS